MEVRVPMSTIDSDKPKRRRLRLSSWVGICICTVLLTLLLVGYVWLSHTYGWEQVFFLWAPSWVPPLMAGSNWEVITGLRDANDKEAFQLSSGHWARKLRTGPDNPEVTVIYDFLSADEVQKMVHLLGNELVERSSGEGEASLSTEVADAWMEYIYSFIRTSTGQWIPEGRYAFAQGISDRIEKLTGMPSGNCEEFYVIRYQGKQQFRAHYDLYDYNPNEPFPSHYNNRVHTVLLYLSNTEGGETIFPLARPPLKVKPRAGNALVWNNCILEPEDSGRCGKTKCCVARDRRSIHAGLPVTGGVKLTASRWIREAEEHLRHNPQLVHASESEDGPDDPESHKY